MSNYNTELLGFAYSHQMCEVFRSSIRNAIHIGGVPEVCAWKWL